MEGVGVGTRLEDVTGEGEGFLDNVRDVCCSPGEGALEMLLNLLTCCKLLLETLFCIIVYDSPSWVLRSGAPSLLGRLGGPRRGFV